MKQVRLSRLATAALLALAVAFATIPPGASADDSLGGRFVAADQPGTCSAQPTKQGSGRCSIQSSNCAQGYLPIPTYHHVEGGRDYCTCVCQSQRK
jgi:hypothetical protein